MLDTAVKKMVERSKGLFVYLSFLPDQLRRGLQGRPTLTMDDLNQAEHFPNGLDDVYTKYFDRFKKELPGSEEEQRTIYQSILGSIVVARTPVPLDMLPSLLQQTSDSMFEIKIQTILRNAQKLLEISTDGKGLRLTHQTMLEYLVEEDKSGLYELRVDETSAHKELGIWCLKNQDTEYALHHAVYHLDKAGLQKEVWQVLMAEGWFEKIQNLAFVVKDALFQIAERFLSKDQVDGSNDQKLRAKQLLSQVFEAQGKYNEAEPLYRESLAIRKKLFSDEHPDVAKSLNNLALLLNNQGKYDQAEPLYRETVAIFKKVHGDEHPAVATGVNNLASLLESQGKYDEAEPLYRESLAIRKKLFGDEHPDVAQSLNNLAALLYNQGKYDEAEPLYREALAIAHHICRCHSPSFASVIISPIQTCLSTSHGHRTNIYSALTLACHIS